MPELCVLEPRVSKFWDLWKGNPRNVEPMPYVVAQACTCATTSFKHTILGASVLSGWGCFKGKPTARNAHFDRGANPIQEKAF